MTDIISKIIEICPELEKVKNKIHNECLKCKTDEEILNRIISLYPKTKKKYKIIVKECLKEKEKVVCNEILLKIIYINNEKYYLNEKFGMIYDKDCNIVGYEYNGKYILDE